MTQPKIISIFGGSAPRPQTPAYIEAQTLGRYLVEHGYTVATGGYGGIMAAASRGAAEAGGHVVGVTCGLLDTWVEGKGANEWVKEEIKFASLSERLYHLVKFCDAALAVGGGIGTLSEISLLWSMIQTHEVPPKPLIVIGALWQNTFDSFLYQADGYVRAEDRAHLQFAPDITTAVKMLNTHFKPH